MILEDPAPTLHDTGIHYAPSQAIQDFIDRCLDKSPENRMNVTEALNHPFLKRAASHHLLQKYLSRKPELNKRDYLVSRATKHKKEQEDSWDELDFINSTWNFNEEPSSLSLKPPPVHTQYLDRVINPETESPITPADGEEVGGSVEQQQQDLLFKKNQQEFLMTKEYYY